MSQPVILKVYGNLAPVTPAQYEKLREIAKDCLPEPETAPASLQDQLLTIMFEGVYFPTEEFLDCIRQFLSCRQQGKIDVLDIEQWTLLRYLIANNQISPHYAPLNNVLDFSGH